MGRHISYDMGEMTWDIYHVGNDGYVMRYILVFSAVEVAYLLIRGAA
jgi:hypothetical protein